MVRKILCVCMALCKMLMIIICLILIYIISINSQIMVCVQFAMNKTYLYTICVKINTMKGYA